MKDKNKYVELYSALEDKLYKALICVNNQIVINGKLRSAIEEPIIETFDITSHIYHDILSSFLVE